MSDGRIRVLALSPIPEEGAGCRFRIAQFIPYLESVGIDVTLRSLFTPEFFRLVYKPGHYLRKAATFAALSMRRLGSLRDLARFDVIFIYREMFPIGPALIERLIAARRRPPIVFDFDDAIFLPSVSDANRLILALKRPQKVAAIIRSSNHVITGNEYLAQYARRFNAAVTTIPTSVDTDLFVPSHIGDPERVALHDPERVALHDPERVALHEPSGNGAAPAREPIVGWIGSPTTGAYIRSLSNVLRRVRERHPFVLRVSGVGEPFAIPGLRIDDDPWALTREVQLFNTCDVGVYPLADDEWSKGKCGFKAIEFMACGVPVVAAAVGVNREIIEDGVNGFLAAGEDEWVDKLGRLLSDAAQRRRFAEAGRRTIQERYSVQVNARKLAATLRDVAGSGEGSQR